MSKKQRISYLDLLRGISILAVVVIHVTSYPVAFLSTESAVYPLYFIVNAGSNFAVPVFLFLSALVLFYQYDDGTKKNWFVFYWKRLKRIIAPYLLWSVFYTVYVSYVQKVSFSEAFTKFIKGLPVGGSYDHLYFMIIIAQFYLLFPLFILLFKLKFVRSHILLFGAAFQVLIYLLNYYYFHLPKIGTFVGSYLMYFFLGAYFAEFIKDAKNNETPKLNWALTIITLLSGAIYIFQKWLQMTNPHWIQQPFLSYINFITNYVFCSLCCAFLLLFVRILERRPMTKKIISSLGACSFGIYFIHPFFLSLWRHYIMTSGPITYHLLVWTGGVIAIFLSWLFTITIIHTPLGVYIVGESKSKIRKQRGSTFSM